MTLKELIAKNERIRKEREATKKQKEEQKRTEEEAQEKAEKKAKKGKKPQNRVYLVKEEIPFEEQEEVQEETKTEEA